VLFLLIYVLFSAVKVVGPRYSAVLKHEVFSSQSLVPEEITEENI